MPDRIRWGLDNPHPLSQMKTELVWEGKYDQYGNRRAVDIAGCAMPLQKIETVDEPASRLKAQGGLFDAEKAHRDDFRNMLVWGDNKLVMASLLKDFKGKIDLIYIDPPFDVGADFTMSVPFGDEKETVERDQSTLEMVAYRDMWGKGFDLCLKSHVLMSPETLTWLRQFERFDLTPHERLALVYLRVNDRLYNRDYVRLADCSSVEATQALRRMVGKGVLAMQGTRGGAYYVLPASLPEQPPSLLDATLTDEERVFRLAQQEGRIKVGMCVKRLGLPAWRASRLLQRLAAQGRLKPHGEKRGRYYTPL